MKYHALFIIFEKNSKIWNCRLLQIIHGALRVIMCNMHFDVPLRHCMSLLMLVHCTAFGGLFKLREVDS